MGTAILASAPASGQFYGELTILGMMRNAPNPLPIISTDTNAGTGDLIHTDDLQFGWAAGIGLRSGVMFAAPVGIEAGGFILAPFVAEQSISTTNDALLFETTPEIALPPTDWLVYFRDQATVWGAEVNLVYQPGSAFTAFAGAALINLRDVLSVRFDEAPAGNVGNVLSTFHYDIDNRMVGPQAGARVAVGNSAQSKLLLSVEGRIGVLYNSINHRLDIVDEATPITIQYSVAEISPVFMVGGAVAASARLTDGLTLSVGYQALLLRNIALATDQVPQTCDFECVTAPLYGIIDTTLTDFFMHGVRFSLALNY